MGPFHNRKSPSLTFICFWATSCLLEMISDPTIRFQPLKKPHKSTEIQNKFWNGGPDNIFTLSLIRFRVKARSHKLDTLPEYDSSKTRIYKEIIQQAMTCSMVSSYLPIGPPIYFLKWGLFWRQIFMKALTIARLEGAKMAIWHVLPNVNEFLVGDRIKTQNAPKNELDLNTFINN